jgi:hypothetical protein
MFNMHAVCDTPLVKSIAYNRCLSVRLNGIDYQSLGCHPHLNDTCNDLTVTRMTNDVISLREASLSHESRLLDDSHIIDVYTWRLTS